jgi:Flp pilus assembly protein TadD
MRSSFLQMQQDSNKDDNPETPLEHARKLLADGEVEAGLAAIKAFWLQNPDDAEAAALFAQAMQEAGRSDLANRLKSLSKRMPEMPKMNDQPDAGQQELFDAGYGLIEARQPELAAMLLQRSAQLVPEEPLVNYELGFALMSSRRFEQAIPYFENSLRLNEDFDSYLNLAFCYTMTRNTDAANKVLEKLSKLTLDIEQSFELNQRKLTLRRLAAFQAKKRLSTRDWLYVLYGAILLKESTRTQGAKEDTVTIGSMLALLKGFIAGLSIELEAIEFYGAQSRPLATALAELFEIPVRIYQGPQVEHRVLLTMTWASDIIGPHQSFADHKLKRSMFSYGLPWNEPLPIIPEIIGCLSDADPMPWHQISGQAKSTSLDNLERDKFDKLVTTKYQEILQNARDHESTPEIIASVQELLDYYSNKENLLVFNNPNAFPRRSEYTAEIPD